MLLLLLFGCILVEVYAQEPTFSPPPKRKYKHADKIETTFDQAKNITTVRLGRMRVLDTANFLELTLFYTYPGQTPATPKNVALGIMARTPDGHFSNKRELVVKADKYILKFGQMELLQNIPFGGGSTQVLATTVPYDVFLRIANAKNIEMKLGDVEFLIKDDQLEAIRDLASRTAP
ncbi:MAG: hypothetical protein M3362_19455 [Acidobacteriota bacterium]|nr:hypothetical protein [Acidobacteriota bacterium]